MATDADARRAAARAGTAPGRGRVALHALSGGYVLDGAPVEEPRGLAGSALSARVHVVTAEEAPARNLLLAVERSHLDVEGLVAAPYAAGLATLVDDEAEIGAVVIDMGAWLTGMALFEGGRLAHVDAVAVGGRHVTLDVARGLDTGFASAERIKTLYGSTLSVASDERETIGVPRAGDDEREVVAQVPRSALVGVVRPRVEEILELVRDRLRAAGIEPATRRIVLTGGACQLTGLPELASRVLSKQVRIGRPLGVKGLPDAAKGPAFAAAVGLLVYPQAAGQELDLAAAPAAAGHSDGYLARVGRWFNHSF